MLAQFLDKYKLIERNTVSKRYFLLASVTALPEKVKLVKTLKPKGYLVKQFHFAKRKEPVNYNETKVLHKTPIESGFSDLKQYAIPTGKANGFKPVKVLENTLKARCFVGLDKGTATQALGNKAVKIPKRRKNKGNKAQYVDKTMAVTGKRVGKKFKRDRDMSWLYKEIAETPVHRTPKPHNKRVKVLETRKCRGY